mmetsp:Transcript_9702/g.20991  ORF Transcript_9702/g.20991 Transcript_9702/m.20991 type:complete len:183 (+) Transcript_9702:1161-1709(+)
MCAFAMLFSKLLAVSPARDRQASAAISARSTRDVLRRMISTTAAKRDIQLTVEMSTTPSAMLASRAERVVMTVRPTPLAKDRPFLTSVAVDAENSGAAVIGLGRNWTGALVSPPDVPKLAAHVSAMTGSVEGHRALSTPTASARSRILLAAGHRFCLGMSSGAASWKKRNSGFAASRLVEGT